MRSIAEKLAYARRNSQKLNPLLFDDGNTLKENIRERILMIVEEFLKYIEVDIKVMDVRLVGSNASYNYSEYSDLDVHIITDISKISDPEIIARLFFDSVKMNFKDAYNIKIKGIDVELYVEDMKTSAVSNGVYSVYKNDWIKEPERVEDPTSEQYSEAESIEANIIKSINSARDDVDALQDIIDELYLLRKDSLSKEGENGAGNIAFKSIRNKGLLDKMKDIIRDEKSKELSLENKKV